jgi:hypothetical protein
MSQQNALSSDIQGVNTGLTDFQKAAELYQRGAEAQRGSMQTSALSERDQLQRTLGDVGVQANNSAEQLSAMRQASATPGGAATVAAGGIPGGVQQQAAQFIPGSSQTTSQAPVGPLGPYSADPRDALMQQILATYQGLLAPRQ